MRGRHRCADQLAGLDRGGADLVRQLPAAARRARERRGLRLRRCRAGARRDRAVHARRDSPAQRLKLSLTLGLTPLYSPQSSAPHGKTSMDDTFPDLGTLTDQELKELIQQLSQEEQEVS